MFKNVRIWIAISVFSLLAACGGGGSYEPRELATQRVVLPSLVNLVFPVNFVIKDEFHWAQMVRTLSANAMDENIAPSGIDFTQHMVLGITLGFVGSGCDDFTIDRVTEENNRIVVSYKEETPTESGAGCVAALVPLYAFVRVERIDGKEVVFVDTTPRNAQRPAPSARSMTTRPQTAKPSL